MKIKALDLELFIIVVIMYQFYTNVSRETILVTCFIELMLLVAHWLEKNWSEYFE